MTELEIKETLSEFVKLFDEIGTLSSKFQLSFLSRFEDILNHINAHDLAHDAEISCLKIRLEKLEKQMKIILG